MLEILHRLEHDMLHALHDQLSDALAPLDMEVLGRVGVDEQHLEFTAVAAVDETGGVETGDAVLEGETAARLDETCVSIGDRHGESGGDEFASSPGAQQRVMTGREIETGITDARVAGHRQVGVESHHRDFEHRGIVERT